MRLHTILLAALFAVSCGGATSPPSGPSPAPPAAWILAGRIVDSVTGQPIANARVTLETRAPIVTDSDGRWRVDGTGAAGPQLPMTVLAPGYVPRETFVNWRSEGRQDVNVELIPERDPFALPFYRYLVRNGLEDPSALQPVRRWTVNPNFYIQTFNPKTGRPLDGAEVDLLTGIIRHVVPQITGGALTAGAIESGEGSRSPRLDSIVIRMVSEPSEEFCGRAFVGANPGEIQINYDRCTSSCGGSTPRIPPAAVAHEIGHALGFWHVDQGLMAAYMSDCSSIQFSEREQLHARVAYRRPSGNTDPDRDPTNFAAVIAGGAPPISCALR